LFFRRIKPDLWVGRFYGICGNAAKTRIRAAGSTCAPMAIVMKERRLETSLRTMLPTYLAMMFEKKSLQQALAVDALRQVPAWGSI